MRAFVAVELPAAVRDALARLQAELGRSLSGWRFTPREALHLTLRFLGQIDERVERDSHERFAVAARAVERFELVTGDLGCFPDARRPRVLWIGVAERCRSRRLAQLAAAIETASRELGLAPEERPFAGHLTLARARREARALAPATPNGPAISFPVDEVVLFESRLGPTGARYTARARFPLSHTS
jgi:RNA 2',3'-cyclic 3'-phosphodiesterase